jgi:pimeloyl-ACP methyl ester carboxylesterase
MAEEVGAEGFIRQQRAIMKRPDSRPDWRRLPIPTLVMVGEEDLITPPAEAQEIAGGIGIGARCSAGRSCRAAAISRRWRRRKP